MESVMTKTKENGQDFGQDLCLKLPQIRIYKKNQPRTCD